MKNDCVFQQSSIAEDMGLEEVRKAQALKFQGRKHAVHACTRYCTQYLPFEVRSPCSKLLKLLICAVVVSLVFIKLRYFFHFFVREFEVEDV